MLLTDSFLPHSGGARVYYYNLYKALAAGFGHTVTVVTKKVPGWQEFDGRETCPTFQIRRRGYPLQTWKYHQLPKIVTTVTAGLHLMVTRPVDMIHIGDLFPPGLAAVSLTRLTGKPFLAFLHGDELAQIEQRRYQPLLRDTVLRNASVIVAANMFARQKALETGIDAKKVHLITPGVDLERFHPAPPSAELMRRYDLTGNVVLLTAARLVPKKGHSMVIRAMSQVLHNYPHVRYLVVGDGPERQNLEHLAASLGVQHAVRFVGNVPNEQLAAFYQTCDVFVMPNRCVEGGDIETFGMVFIEANAAGKPVIGGRSGGALEAVEHGRTGFLVNPDSIDDLVGALQALVSNEELRARVGAAGLRRVRTEFTWGLRAERLHNVCLEAARASRRVVA
jgi:phosphatidylinositol alpha-1,6-mannosyltransferase